MYLIVIQDCTHRGFFKPPVKDSISGAVALFQPSEQSHIWCSSKDGSICVWTLPKPGEVRSAASRRPTIENCRENSSIVRQSSSSASFDSRRDSSSPVGQISRSESDYDCATVLGLDRSTTHPAKSNESKSAYSEQFSEASTNSESCNDNTTNSDSDSECSTISM